jgi:hypothetical protein
MAELDHADAGKRQIHSIRHQLVSFMPTAVS